MLKKLLNKKMKFLKNQQGLTLIELLVVIVILGIIAAIAIPAVIGQSDKAKENADAQTLSVLNDALKRYQAVEGKDPVAVEGKTAIDALTPSYIDEIPAKCANGDDATFELDGSGATMKVKSSCIGD